MDVYLVIYRPVSRSGIAVGAKVRSSLTVNRV